MLILCMMGLGFLNIAEGSQWGVENLFLLNSPLCMTSILVGKFLIQFQFSTYMYD